MSDLKSGRDGSERGLELQGFGCGEETKAPEPRGQEIAADFTV
jgi:hypothetical protein